MAGLLADDLRRAVAHLEKHPVAPADERRSGFHH